MKQYEDNPMLARGKQRLSSQGQDIRVLFKIEIQKVIVTNDSSEKDFVTGLSVCFERGLKLAISSEHKAKLIKGQPVTVDFNETLSLVTTLHKDSSGNYKDKLGKLIVRRPTPSALGGTGFAGLGLASLPLHRLVADFQSQQFMIPLTNNNDAVGRIDVVITSKFISEVTPDETSDDEGDGAISPVETADFDDHSSSSGESKRGGLGRKEDQETSADKAYESALSASSATNKAAAKKAEALSAEYDKLQSKHNKVVAEVADQEEIIGMLQQQLQEAGKSKNRTNIEEVQDLEEEIETYRDKTDQQDIKLKQAAEYITYQEEQIAALTNEIQDLNAKVEAGTSKKPSKDSNSERALASLSEELDEQRSRAEAYLTQLRDGAKYVQTIQDQLNEANEEVSRLQKEKSSPQKSPKRDELSHLRDEIAAKDEKIEQASEYVTFQRTQIDQLTAELEEMTAAVEEEKLKHSNPKKVSKELEEDLRAQLEECEGRLEKGAEYVDYLQAQMEELQTEIDNLKRAEEVRRSLEDDEDNDHKAKAKASKGQSDRHEAEMRAMSESLETLQGELEQSKAYCKSYLHQLSQGGELVNELQKEVKVKSELIVVLNEEMHEMEVTATSLKNQVKAKTEELRSSSRVSSEVDSTISNLERDLKATRAQLETLERELLHSQQECEEAHRKVEKLEKSGGAKGRNGRGGGGGGYDANVDRISDLEDELELLKIRLENTQAESEGSLRAKEQEAEYYKDQSEQYLKKLQEGAEYVNNLQAQMKELEEETERLKERDSQPRASFGRADPFAPGTAAEEELKECKLIIHKYGGKLEQASSFIDDLENQLAEAREKLENRSVDGGSFRGNDYSSHGDSQALKSAERKVKELEATVSAMQSEMEREDEHSADQIMSDLISYKMQYAMAAADVEVEKKKNKDSSAKLQSFARKISELENALSDAHEHSANESKGMFSYFRGSSAGSTAGSTAGSSHGGNTPIRHGPSSGMRPQQGRGVGGTGSAGGGRGQGARPGGPALQAVRR